YLLSQWLTSCRGQVWIQVRVSGVISLVLDSIVVLINHINRCPNCSGEEANAKCKEYAAYDTTEQNQAPKNTQSNPEPSTRLPGLLWLRVAWSRWSTVRRSILCWSVLRWGLLAPLW